MPQQCNFPIWDYKGSYKKKMNTNKRQVTVAVIFPSHHYTPDLKCTSPSMATCKVEQIGNNLCSDKNHLTTCKTLRKVHPARFIGTVIKLIKEPSKSGSCVFPSHVSERHKHAHLNGKNQCRTDALTCLPHRKRI